MLPAIGFIKQETKSGEKHFFLIINLMYSVHSINMKPYFLFKVTNNRFFVMKSSIVNKIFK